MKSSGRASRGKGGGSGLLEVECLVGGVDGDNREGKDTCHAEQWEKMTPY